MCLFIDVASEGEKFRFERIYTSVCCKVLTENNEKTALFYVSKCIRNDFHNNNINHYVYVNVFMLDLV